MKAKRASLCVCTSMSASFLPYSAGKPRSKCSFPAHRRHRNREHRQPTCCQSAEGRRAHIEPDTPPPRMKNPWLRISSPAPGYQIRERAAGHGGNTVLDCRSSNPVGGAIVVCVEESALRTNTHRGSHCATPRVISTLWGLPNERPLVGRLEQGLDS